MVFIGVLEDIVAEWDVPVDAHALARPFLDGSAPYPTADPSGGGMLGRPLTGVGMRRAPHVWAGSFDRVAVPPQKCFVELPLRA